MAKDGLTKEQVEHIAKLANLPLNTSEIQTFQEQLSEVVEYVGKIREVKGKKRKAKRELRPNALRDDVKGDVIACLSQEDALSGTENKHNGLFVVPAIFDE